MNYVIWLVVCMVWSVYSGYVGIPWYVSGLVALVGGVLLTAAGVFK